MSEIHSGEGVVPCDDSLAQTVPPAAQQDHSDPAQTDSGFAQLDLRKQVHQAVEQSGYSEPTEVQSAVIPHLMAGRDVLAQSQTGSGKTAAFALPLLSRIDFSRQSAQVLVLTPTRELAMQVAESFRTYAKNLKSFRVVAIYGGQDYEIQLRALRRGVQVVVGTPGRVIDHVKRGTLDLSQLDCLVLDEADEMLNMGFLEDVQFVLDQTPPERQIALFSATLPAPIRKIADQYLNDPATVTIKKKTMTAESIRQRAVFAAPRDKIHVLTRFLEAEETDGVIVFTKTKDATVHVAEQLNREGFSAVALNGDMPQRVRERTIDQLKSGRLNVLVATDVAARGLDVSRISHVFNFDLPHDSESYIHRIGRTGRAGREGEAIIFLTNAQRSKVRLIERATHQKLEIVQPPTADEINALRIKRFLQRITDVTAEKDLTMFKELLRQYCESSGKPIEMIAAALAEISLDGRDFLLKDRPPRSHEHRVREKHGREDRGREGKRGSKQDFDGPRSRGRRFEARPVEDGMKRYRIEVGRRDGVRPGNIVGAVANEGGIDSEFIGPIMIHDSFSTIDLPQGMPGTIFQTLRRTRVSGKPLRISVDRDEAGSHRDGKSERPRGGRSHGQSSKRTSKPKAKSRGGFGNPKPGKGKKHKKRLQKR